MASVTEFFAGTSRFSATLDVRVYGDEADVVIFARRLSGPNVKTSGSQLLPWSFRASAPGWAGKDVDGQWRYDFGGSGVQRRTVMRYRLKDLPAGPIEIEAQVSIDFGSGSSTRQATPGPLVVTVGGPPSKMMPLSMRDITRTSMQAYWTAPNANYSPITGIDVFYNTTKSGIGAKVVSSAPARTGRTLIADLAPDTAYFFAVRAKNALGLGPLSDWVGPVYTLTALGPEVSVVSDGTGTAADIAVAPGSTTGAIVRYDLQVEYLSPQIPNPPAPRTITVPNSGQLRLQGLIPGAQYRYRARARMPEGPGPWSIWVQATQNAPALPPGTYFDGSYGTRSDGDLTFGWAGTPQLSESRAYAPKPLGWAPFPAADEALGALGVVFSIRGGLFGDRAVRAQFHRAPTGRGVRFTTSRVPIETPGTYFGGVHVRSSKRKRLRAVVVWYGSMNQVLRTDVGTEIVALANPDEWARVSTPAEMPADATQVAVGVEETLSATEDNPRWASGDTLDMDGASLFFGENYNYFDGSTSNTGEGYAYFWQGAENSTRSYREDAPIDEALVLVDPDCVTIPSPPRPPSIPMECVDDSGLWNRYWARVAPQYGLWVDTVPTLWIEALKEAERQVRVRWFRVEGRLEPVYGPWLEAHRNLFVNPALNASQDGASVVLARNLARGPYPVEGYGWGSPGGEDAYTVTVDDTVPSPNAGRATAKSARVPTWTYDPAVIGAVASIGSGVSFEGQEPAVWDAVHVKENTTYTAAIEILTPYDSPTYRIEIVYFASNGGGVSYEAIRPSTTPASTWSRQIVTFTTNPGTLYVYMNVYVLTNDGSAAPTGVPVWVGEAIFQEGVTVDPYFDGSSGSAVAEGFFYAWQGEVAGSESVRRAEIPLAVSAYVPPSGGASDFGSGGFGDGPFGGVSGLGSGPFGSGPFGGIRPLATEVWASRSWASTGVGRSMVIHPTSASDPQTAAVLGGQSTDGMNAGLAAGEAYTVLAKFYQDEPQAGALDDSFARRIRVVYNTVAGDAGATVLLGEQLENVAGVAIPARMSFTLPEDAVWAQVQLGNGAALNGGDVYWDDIAIVPGIYDGEWFDGSSYPSGEGTTFTAWEGEPDRSVSVLYERTEEMVWAEIPVDQMDPSSFVAEQVITYLPTGGRIVLDGVDQQAWFEKANGVSLPAGYLLAGSSGRPPSWPVLSCTEAYYLTVDVPTTSPDGNLNIVQGMTAVVL